MTTTERKVIDHMNANEHQRYFGLDLMSLIFSTEVIEKYNHARLNSVVIEKMTWLYLGKMARKGLIRWSPKGYTRNGNS